MRRGRGWSKEDLASSLQTIVLAALALLLAALSLAANAALARRVRQLETELLRRPESRQALGENPPENPLAGVRVKINVHQDHPLSPFETLLAESLARAGAIRVHQEPQVQIDGTLKGNGYADVYFDADLTVQTNGQTLFRLLEKPPHGDRPENLAREVVARLAAEWTKQERQGALRELGGA